MNLGLPVVVCERTPNSKCGINAEVPVGLCLLISSGLRVLSLSPFPELPFSPHD